MYMTEMLRRVIIFISTVFIAISDCEQYNEEAWQEAADFLNQGYNSSAKPCEDFTNFACGKWIKEFGKEQVNQLYSHYGILYKNVAESILAVDEDDEEEVTPKYKIWVKTFFEQCLNHTDLENNNETIKELFTSLVKILGMPPILNSNLKTKESSLKRNIWNFLGYLQREIPLVKVFFSVSIELIAVDCKGLKPVLKFTSETWNDDHLNKTSVAQSTKILAHLLNAKLDEKEMVKKIDKMVEFENELIQFFNVTEQAARYQPQAEPEEEKEITLENAITISDLKHFNPNISWIQYFRGLFSEEQYGNWNQSEPLILVDDTQFFDLLEDVVGKFDTETIFNYIFYKSIVKFYKLISSEYNSATESKCTEMVIKLFKSASSRMLFDHLQYDAFEYRYDIKLLAETIFAAFKFLVVGSDWLDAEDKAIIIDKANQISFFPGIPDWFKNDSEIERRTIEVKPESSTVENFFTITKNNFDRDLDYIVGLSDINMENEPELEVNAFYMGMSIEMKLGYAIPPWYNPKFPLAVKYGFLGYTLGHELMHGFDAERVHEIPSGAKKWLKPETLQTFTRKRDCLIKQYSAYCFKKQNQCLSGRKTITENMADIDGLKIAYMAYKFASQTIGEEPPLPGFVDLTGDQIFFLTAARTACSTGSEVADLLNMVDEPHAPDQARVDVPFRNFAVFAKLFGCSVGSFYSPMNTCSMWGSYNAGSKFQ